MLPDENVNFVLKGAFNMKKLSNLFAFVFI